MEIVHLYISPAHSFFGHHGKPPSDAPMVEVAEVECVAGRGIVGDRFFDYKEDYKGQITFFAQETYEALCRKFDLHDRPPSVFRRNAVVRGADLPALVGHEFTLGAATFFGTQEAAPCYWMNTAFCDGAEEALKGHGGLRATIVRGGTLRAGDHHPVATPSASPPSQPGK